MKELFALLCDRLERRRPTALATVIAHEGSTPRGAGSRLIADANGLVVGTIGGGLAEAQALAACRRALDDGTARILDFRLSGELAAKSDMICGGSLRVLIEPLTSPEATLPLFRAVRDALNGDGAALVTDVTDASRPVRTALIGGQAIGAPLAAEIIAELMARVPPTRAAGVHRHEKRDYVIEYCRPPLRMIIAGGGHVSRPTAQVAALAGFEVTVLDDRPEFSRPERFPWAAATATVPDYRDCFAKHAPDARSFIVIVTRGHLHDAAVLAQALATRAGYIGMIGSRRKRAEVYAAMRAQGFGDEALARVHCPIGLDIGAETPEEIAVSIVAECVAHRKKTCPSKNLPL